MIRKTLGIALTFALCGTVSADITQSGPGARQFKVGDKPASIPAPNTGEQALTDASGLEYFINTDITFTTSSSASGAASEASYTAPVAATTAMNGTTNATLDDAFDGYNSICISIDGATGPCVSGGGGGTRGIGTVTMFNQNGPATLDAACSNRQIIYPTQTINGIAVQRKVFVPANDEFARWTNTFTNTTGAAITMTMITSNNLGSDSTTTIVTSSSGDAAVTTADFWATTFQNFSGNTSTDPRLGHVFGGPGGSVGLSGISFANGDDNPFWRYSLTLQPGQTQSIVNFATGQPSRADAAAKAAQLISLTGTAASCMSAQELAQVVNYAAVGGAQNQPVPFADQRVVLAVGGMLLLVGLVALRRHSA